MKARVSATITFITNIPDDPECYEGADTPEARMEKEREYLAEDGDYLIQALSLSDHKIDVLIAPVKDEGDGHE